MTIPDADLRAALHRASDHIQTPPDLLDGVRRLGGRRLMARRSFLGAGVTAAVAGSTVGVGLLRTSFLGVPVSSPLLTGPSLGDLAGDRRYLDRVEALFRRQADAAGIRLRGTPHVVWAANTPAGPAAVVAQQCAPGTAGVVASLAPTGRPPVPTASAIEGGEPVPTASAATGGGPVASAWATTGGGPVATMGAADPSHRRLPGQNPSGGPAASPPSGRDAGVIGFIEPTAAGPAMLSLEPFDVGAEDLVSQAMLLGSDRDVLVVCDFGGPVEYSTEPRYESDGRITRTFRPVPFAAGAAVLRVPPQRAMITLALGRPAIGRSAATPVWLAGSGSSPQQAMAYTGRVELRHLSRPAASGGAVQADDLVLDSITTVDAEQLAPYLDRPGGYLRPSQEPGWYLAGTTPDGQRLRVRTLQYEGGPCRLVATLTPPAGPPRVLYGGLVDTAGPLPIRARLPENRGVVVAALGATLRYRSPAGGWTDVTTADAALLPAQATEVRVTRPGQAPIHIPLP